MSIILSVSTSFFLCFLMMPIVIHLFKKLEWIEKSNIRKIHPEGTPSMGGIAIFLSLLVGVVMSASIPSIVDIKYFFLALLIIFILGIRDDMKDVKVMDKLFIQIFAAIILVVLGDFEIKGLNGIFEVSTFGSIGNIFFTVFIIISLTNAFNLIDGIDGLSASIALLNSLIFGGLFIYLGNNVMACVAFSISGSVLAFLFFNWSPSKIFMGDTGAMILGFSLVALMIEFLSLNSVPSTSIIVAPVAFSISLLILPIYDALRVIIIRAQKGVSILSPDRNHIHHVLLSCGMNHAQTTLSLISYNIILISLIFFLQNVLSELVLLIIIASLTIITGFIVSYISKKKSISLKLN